MVGLDRNVDRLAKESERVLGPNTLFIFSSDNGVQHSLVVSMHHFVVERQCRLRG